MNKMLNMVLAMVFVTGVANVSMAGETIDLYNDYDPCGVEETKNSAEVRLISQKVDHIPMQCCHLQRT